ncbi:MAG: hypothetical protein M3R47_00955 [Chloroflexota bacterium]|nr:hypothetical protein [Chloroflexota bacterium]
MKYALIIGNNKYDSTGVAGITVNTSELNRAFSIFSILFAIPAAFFFFLRKEQSLRV